MSVSINVKNKPGETPLFMNIVNGLINIIDLSRSVITIFQDVGADFLAQNNKIDTLLHIATRKACHEYGVVDNQNREDIVACFKYLLELGCDQLSEDINHRMALDATATCENGDISKPFKEMGN